MVLVYMVTLIPSICPSHVSINTSTSRILWDHLSHLGWYDWYETLIETNSLMVTDAIFSNTIKITDIHIDILTYSSHIILVGGFNPSEKY